MGGCGHRETHSTAPCIAGRLSTDSVFLISAEVLHQLQVPVVAVQQVDEETARIR